MSFKNPVIESVDVIDLRVPTSDTLVGSDPFHKKPNYSAVLTHLHTNEGITGTSVSFTLGAGNDWLAYGVKDLASLVMGRSLNEFIDRPGKIHRMLVDHHQLRWLADGMARMAIGSLINALWDLWAWQEGKPLWKLLVGLEPEQIIESIDWRYLGDGLLPGEALEILQNRRNGLAERETRILKRGPKAYSTAGWLGLTDEEIVQTITEVRKSGLDCFKMKVGENLDRDHERLGFIRGVVGEEDLLMLDANQIWGVEEAINHMKQLVEFRPHWIEEPTARDDVLGFLRISEALVPYGIGVACGEQVPSPVIFKQLLQSGAIQFCQIDATRLGGVNDVMAVILMAAKYEIPVCPHGGGIGLCNMIIHYALWDQISIASQTEGRFVEYLNFLQDDVFLNPVVVDSGSYVAPSHQGWGLEMDEKFISRHVYPAGKIWRGREASGGIGFLA